MSQAGVKIGLVALVAFRLTCELNATVVAKPALTQEQVMTVVTASKFGITPERAVEIIRERGIAFAVTESFLKKLEAREADPAIVAVLKDLAAKRETAKQPAVARGATKTAPKPPRAPPAPKVDLLPPGTPPTPENWDQFLESVRTRILDYTDTLPNFACNQGTREYQAIGRRGWTERGTFEVEVSYYDKSPHYKQLSRTNTSRPVGEFGPVLRGLFAPATQAIFRMQGLEKKQGQQTARLAFEVPRETSKRTLSVKDKGAVAFGYRGRCWVDLDTYLVIRLESESTDMPEGALLANEQLLIRYKEVALAEDRFWLPAEVHLILKTRALGDGGLNEGGVSGVDTTQMVSLRYVSFFRRYRPFERQ